MSGQGRRTDNETATLIGKNLAKKREEQKLSQGQLAIKATINRPTISRIEQGQRMPDLLTAMKLSKALDISLDELCGLQHLTK